MRGYRLRLGGQKPRERSHRVGIPVADADSGMSPSREQELPKWCGMERLHDLACGQDAMDLSRTCEMNSKILSRLQLLVLHQGHDVRQIGISAVRIVLRADKL